MPEEIKAFLTPFTRRTGAAARAAGGDRFSKKADIGLQQRLAHTAVQLLLASEAVHVGCWAADIPDVAFESGVLRDVLHFVQDGLRAAPAHRSPFVDGDGAEVAFAVAAAMVETENRIVSRL
jgi:hypothetical protein